MKLLFYTLFTGISLLTLFLFGEVPQPDPLILNNTTSIQPILENADLDKKYHYIQTIKVYYVDSLSTPIELGNGDKMYTRCTDSTRVTFFSKDGVEPISLWSTKRMSCKIVAIVNLDEKSIHWLRYHPLKMIEIYNHVTGSTQLLGVKDAEYFRNLFKQL